MKGLKGGLAIIGILGVVAGGIAVAATAKKEAAPTRIVIADSKTTHHLNLYVAKELGLFDKHGLDVAIVDSKELSAARDLVVSGQADVFWSCPTVAISAIGNGAPLKIIAQVKTPCTSVLLVPENSPIRTYKDLKGKRIGGISPTCEAVIAYEGRARKAGGEFQLEKLAGGPAIAALEAGKIDGAILEEPHVSIAELKGFKVVMREAAEQIPCRTINARTGFLKENADALRRLVEAVNEANAVILRDPTAREIVEIARKYTAAPEDAIRRGNHRLKFTVKLQTEGLSLLADELVAQKSIRENPRDGLFADEFKGFTWGL